MNVITKTLTHKLLAGIINWRSKGSIAQRGAGAGADSERFWGREQVTTRDRHIQNVGPITAAQRDDRLQESSTSKTICNELRDVKTILCTYRKKLVPKWQKIATTPKYLKRQASCPKLMVGTLYSGENEFSRCKRSIQSQTYTNKKHVVIPGLGKKESVNTLMKTFLTSDCDVLVKVDADVVLTNDHFLERLMEIFRENDSITMVQAAIQDFFSGDNIQGINAYRKPFNWDDNSQDVLFTDKVNIPASQRLVVWSTFVNDAVHAPAPTAFQSFHFGVHRGLKVIQHDVARYDPRRSNEQRHYLERTWNRFRESKEKRLGFACLGFELALCGYYTVRDLDYTRNALKQQFNSFRIWDAQKLENRILELRKQRLSKEPLLNVLCKHNSDKQNAYPINSILALLPHTETYGGVNRFFELARCFGKIGIESVIAQPNRSISPFAKESARDNEEYPHIKVYDYSQALDKTWDVVICGDALCGTLLTLPLFKARLTAAYLLNGWMHAPFNVRQIDLVRPEIVIANSSYCARYYKGFAPTIIPGGIDTDLFHPLKDCQFGKRKTLKLCAYAGRLKPRKRFEDVIDACHVLQSRRIPFELHAYDQHDINLQLPFPHVFHRKLSRSQVRDLLRGMDIMICPEEDAGWSNPAAEAAASGVPLVCTEAGTIDFAIPEKSALVVPTHEPVAIADAVQRLYKNPAYAFTLRESAYKNVQQFSWHIVAERLLQTLKTARLDQQERQDKNRKTLQRYKSLGLRLRCNRSRWF